MPTELKNTIEKLDYSSISEERKAELQLLIDYVKQKRLQGEVPNLNLFVER